MELAQEDVSSGNFESILSSRLDSCLEGKQIILSGLATNPESQKLFIIFAFI